MVDAAFLAHYVGRTILITGAAGFLGRHLTARVASLARSVVCVARGPRAGSHRNVRFHPVDLNDADRTCAFFDTVKPDIVFHLASASGGSTGVENVLPHLRDDICTTVNCLVAAQKTGVSRFVIPGSTDEPPPGADYVPDSPYSMAKMTCVTFGRMFHELYAVPTVICRIFMTYGPGQKPRKIVPFMIRSMLAHEAPTLNSGARLVDWVFVDDTVDALMLAGLKPEAIGKTVEIGSGALISIGDLAQKLRTMIPGAPPGKIGAGAFYGRARAADLGAASRYLQWSPKVSLDEGLLETVAWYKRQSVNAALSLT